MIEQLIEKLTNSQSYFQSLTGQLLGFNTFREDNKFYYIMPDEIRCYDLDIGRTYIFEKNWGESDWHLYRLLYLKSYNEKKFRIDVPIKQEISTVNGENWQYTEVMRPGLENGEYIRFYATSTAEDMATKAINIYELLIDQVYELLSASKEISLENNSGIPLFTGKFGEDAEGYYFLKNFGIWNSSISENIDKIIKKWSYNNNDFANLPEEYKIDWAIRARTKWEILL
jgi:hypothetical protein